MKFHRIKMTTREESTTEDRGRRRARLQRDDRIESQQAPPAVLATGVIASEPAMAR